MTPYLREFHSEVKMQSLDFSVMCGLSVMMSKREEYDEGGSGQDRTGQM